MGWTTINATVKRTTTRKRNTFKVKGAHKGWTLPTDMKLKLASKTASTSSDGSPRSILDATTVVTKKKKTKKAAKKVLKMKSSGKKTTTSKKVVFREDKNTTSCEPCKENATTIAPSPTTVVAVPVESN